MNDMYHFLVPGTNKPKQITSASVAESCVDCKFWKPFLFFTLPVTLSGRALGDSFLFYCACHGEGESRARVEHKHNVCVCFSRISLHHKDEERP